MPRRMVLGPDRILSCEEIEQSSQESVRFVLSDAAISGMKRSHDAFLALVAEGRSIYGTTTGFGPFVTYAGANGTNQGASLLAHLGAGWEPRDGAWTPSEVVRGAMLIRSQNLVQGFSGIMPEVVLHYLQFLEKGIVPLVPTIGSVGASGDLVPLSHIARAVAGMPESRVFFQGETLSAREAIERAGLNCLLLDGREALALTNGTSYLTAYAALSVARAERLLYSAERITGWIYRLLGARIAAVSPALHEARGHIGQVRSARNIREEAMCDGNEEDITRPLQEVYSLRCAPQVLGACRESLDFARRIITTEVNGVSDNPLIFTDDAPTGRDVLHGGNFHGQQVAFAADALNAALTQAAVLAERQIDILVTPSATNENAPLLLAFEPGRSSGLAGVQLTATALVAEMRSHAQAHATMSIPTNGRNQDVVSMGALAARHCYEQTERLAAVLATLTIAATQLTFLRQENKATGRIVPLPSWLPTIEGIVEDRPLLNEIRALTEVFCTPKSNP